jgi:hypothetical protein
MPARPNKYARPYVIHCKAIASACGLPKPAATAGPSRAKYSPACRRSALLGGGGGGGDGPGDGDSGHGNGDSGDEGNQPANRPGRAPAEVRDCLSEPSAATRNGTAVAKNGSGGSGGVGSSGGIGGGCRDSAEPDMEALRGRGRRGSDSRNNSVSGCGGFDHDGDGGGGMEAFREALRETAAVHRWLGAAAARLGRAPPSSRRGGGALRVCDVDSEGQPVQASV